MGIPTLDSRAVGDEAGGRLNGQPPAADVDRWAVAFEHAPIGTALVGLDGSWLAVNRALCEFLHRTESDLLRTDFPSVTHPDDCELDLGDVARLVSGESDRYETEKRYLRPDGTVVRGRLSVALARDGQGRPLHFISQLQGIATREDSEVELVRYSAELNELARRDPLTGLRNYREFHSMLDAELDRARRYGEDWSLLLFDVDGFHELNRRDRSEGDRLLQAVARAITGACRSSDLAARIGADEFALILPHTAAQDAASTASRIAREIARAGIASLSYGAASWPGDGNGKELLLVRADMELRRAQSRRQGAAAGTPSPTPTPGGEPESDAVHEILSLARQHVDMDVAFLSEIDEGSERVVAVSGLPGAFGISEGQTIASHSLATAAGVASYIEIPVTLMNGHRYGTLAALDGAPAGSVDERHRRTLQSLSRLLATHIERDARSAAERQSQAELAGMDGVLAALAAREHTRGPDAVVALATEVARSLGLADAQMSDVAQVARLHDIGTVGIPDSVLQKPGPLNETEWDLIRQHPAIGARMLAATRTLGHLAPAVKCHHERFDGHGYPDGLRGDAIPLASRITFACDAYDAMVNARPYRPAIDDASALEKLRAGAGSQFDPLVVEAILCVLGTPGARSREQLCDPGPRGELLVPQTPRQTPVWEPGASPRSPAAIGQARAECRRCGTHVPALVTRAAIGGQCTNCGSYDLVLIETARPTP